MQSVKCLCVREEKEGEQEIIERKTRELFETKGVGRQFRVAVVKGKMKKEERGGTTTKRMTNLTF